MQLYTTPPSESNHTKVGKKIKKKKSVLSPASTPPYFTCLHKFRDQSGNGNCPPGQPFLGFVFFFNPPLQSTKSTKRHNLKPPTFPGRSIIIGKWGLSALLAHLTEEGRLGISKGAMIARPVACIIIVSTWTTSFGCCSLAPPNSHLAACTSQVLWACCPATGTVRVHIW